MRKVKNNFPKHILINFKDVYFSKIIELSKDNLEASKKSD